MRRRALGRTPALLLATSLVVGCAVYGTATVVPPKPEGTTTAPVRVYLPAGHIVLFQDGFTIAADTIHGSGARYDPALQLVGTVYRLPLDSVVGMEAIQGTGPNVPATVLASTVGIAAGAAAAGLLAVAIFGSCPTVYVPAPHPDSSILVAELFSHSVAPLLEGRDVDVYPGRVENGTIRLDLRNEAMETHFINHLELMEVVQAPGEEVVSDAHGLPLSAAGWLRLDGVRDRSGRDVSRILATADEEAFATLPSRVSDASAHDLADHIELSFPRPGGADSVAVALRLRNSLLNTVLLYDFLLSGEDLRGIRWLTETLQQVGTAVEFGAWYRERMGLHVEVWADGDWQRVGRVPDTGPIAWKSTAVMVPVPDEGDVVRIRLVFLVDHWRIDQVRVAGATRRPEARVLPVSRVIGAADDDTDAMRAALLSPDDRYLETRPGTALFVEFDSDARPGERRYLLSSQGYYTEWIRPSWVRAGSAPAEPFVPGDDGLMQVLSRWQRVQDDMEARFESTRIPTSRGGDR